MIEAEITKLLAEREPLIMCFPTDFAEYKPYKDSSRVRADCCGREVWLGPAQRKVKEERGAPVVCAVCLIQLLGPERVQQMMVRLTDKQAGD